MAPTKGAWIGSNADEDMIEHHRRCRRILPTDKVICRLPPKGERVPKPEANEVIVFSLHFNRGFGLPASLFLRKFLNHFKFQT